MKIDLNLLLRKSLKYMLRFFLGFFSLVGLYILLAYLLPMIPVNNDFRESPDGIEVFLISNGVHTDICIPLESAEKDWSNFLGFESFQGNPEYFTYLSCGWGDKGFYLNTPTWADLTFSTAFTAAFLPSSTAMHITIFNERPLTGENIKKVKVSPEQFSKIEGYIYQQFELLENRSILIDSYHYPESNDNFYEARGYYSLFRTCNNWTNDVLKQAGIRTGLWTPFDSGILRYF